MPCLACTYAALTALSIIPIVAAESILSIFTDPPKATLLPFIVIEELESFALVIEPFSCVLDTPPGLIETAPEVTEKSAVANDAMPLLDVVASSPDTSI